LQKYSENYLQLVGFDIQKPDLLSFFTNIKFTSDTIYAPYPKVDIQKCRYCGNCAHVCKGKAILFNRYIPSVRISMASCFACAECKDACTRNGIEMTNKLAGEIFTHNENKTEILIGNLDKDSEFEIPITKVLTQLIHKDCDSICDFGPGVSDAVKVGLENIDFSLLVLKPTKGWQRNLSILIEMCKHLRMSFGILTNKTRLEEGFISEIKDHCNKTNIPYLGNLAFNPEIENGCYFDETLKSEEIKRTFKQIWSQIIEIQSQKNQQILIQ